MHLTDTMQRYIVHWGEMGSRWGMNRSVAQIHALLYLSEKPLNADEIAETLGIARSNVSTGLKELVGWELVQITHVLGDRRDFFAAQHDTWEVIRVIMEGRKRREIDPTLAALRECAALLKTDRDTPAAVRERITREKAAVRATALQRRKIHCSALHSVPGYHCVTQNPQYRTGC
jgi:DNA-binding transcriptional regulator GbsR (MarR family)